VKNQKKSYPAVNKISKILTVTPNPPLSPITWNDIENTYNAKQDALSFEKKKIINTDTQIEPESTEEYNTDLDSIATLNQRFLRPLIQSRKIQHLFPQRQHLLTRQSKRCAICDKLLIKPDLNPAKIEFKRQQSAFLLIPRITIASIPKLVVNKEIFVVLVLTNPSKYTMTINLTVKEELSEAIVTIPTIPKVCGVDYTETEEEYEELRKKDDPNIVALRKGNKLFTYITVKPIKECTQLKIPLSMTALSQKQDAISYDVLLHLTPILPTS